MTKIYPGFCGSKAWYTTLKCLVDGCFFGCRFPQRFFAKPGLCRLVPVCGAPWGHKGLVSLSPRRFEKPAGPGHGAPGWGAVFFFVDFRVTLKVGDVLKWRRPWRGAGLLSLFCKCCVFFGGVSGRGGWRGAITFFRLRFKDVAYYVTTLENLLQVTSKTLLIRRNIFFNYLHLTSKTLLIRRNIFK